MCSVIVGSVSVHQVEMHSALRRAAEGQVQSRVPIETMFMSNYKESISSNKLLICGLWCKHMMKVSNEIPQAGYSHTDI